MMTKRERVLAAIQGKEVDGIPSCFSLHFFTPDKKPIMGEAGIRKHLSFFQESDADIIKIMDEYRLVPDHIIRTPEDFNKAIPQDVGACSIVQDQIDYTKRIMRHAPKDVFSIGTLHGVFATAVQTFMKMGDGYLVNEAFEAQALFLRWNEKEVLDAYQRIADGLCELVRGYIKDCGMDGVFYTSIAGMTKYLTDEEHAKWVKPFDLQVMKAIKDAGGYCVLHICSAGVNMDRFDADYEALSDVINWGTQEVPMTLEEGREHFHGKTILGGLPHHSGVLVNGTEAEVREAVRDIVKKFGRKGLILGADCALFTQQDMKLLKAAIDEARSL